MQGWTIRHRLLLVGLAFLAIGCSRGQAGAAGITTTSSATALPVATPAQVLRETKADLDNDGTVEQITLSQAGDHPELAIASVAGLANPWRMNLPARVSVTDLSTQDLIADRALEVLVLGRGPEADLFQLWVIRWHAGQGQLLKPKGGPLDGGDSFRSWFYPPLVDDLDGDAVREISVSVKGSDPHFLDTIVYAWDGQAYSRSDLYLMPPRIMPTAAAASQATQ